MKETINPIEEAPQLETSTYEILQRRLESHTTDLLQRMDKLNAARKDVFGAVEMQLTGTERILTEHNCISRDMVAIGNQFIFGYNVHMGLRTSIKLSDVFSIFRFQKSDHSFHEGNVEMLNNPNFEEDFQNLYKYYKDTVFSKFARIGPHLFMVFQVGNQATDVKTFKWAIQDESLTYLGNRFDHEVRVPDQHSFQWKKTTREMHRKGEHPHISVLDRVFVETVGGDLTLKVEDNTDSGQGIYTEPVDHADQTLDDADFYFADLGNLIVLKIRPYQEKSYRYIIYNDKIQEAIRVDALEKACVLLPDNQGIIFSNGYYLQTGTYKIFDQILPDLNFEKRIVSFNGEDFLYVFYHLETGTYVMLPYNLVAQTVDTPLVSNGFSIFPDGELCYFRSEVEQSRQHTIQIWNTPFGEEVPVNGEVKSSFLAKIGNKDLVKGLAACNELITLIRRGDSYGNLYAELSKKASTLLDAYHWIDHPETFALAGAVKDIRSAALTAIGEFDKVQRTKQHTKESLEAVLEQHRSLSDKIRRYKPKNLETFVGYLGDLRILRGEIIGLRELKYIVPAQVDELEEDVVKQSDGLSEACVNFLLQPEALQEFSTQIKAQEAALPEIKKVTDANEQEAAIDKTSADLELLMETVSNLPIDDATATTDLVERISELFAHVNSVRARLVQQRKELAGKESSAEFHAQLKLLDQAVIHHLDRCDTPADCEQNLTRLMVRVEELEGKFADYEDFVEEINLKREEVYQVFENRRVALVETRAKRADGLMNTADRILKGIQNRLDRFETIAEINAYFAADLMIAKVRDILKQLEEMNDTIKVADLQSRMKTLREEAVRQLKDRKELFTEGDNVIKLGNHAFSVNHQPLELTLIPRQGQMFAHLTGTQFFEAIDDEDFQATEAYWDQSFISENQQVYRAAYLAYRLFQDNGQIQDSEVEEAVRQYMATHLAEGYVKGIHDKDAGRILTQLLHLKKDLGFLHYSPEARACAAVYWDAFIGKEEKSLLTRQLKGAGVLMKTFPEARQFDSLIHVLQENIRICNELTHLFDESLAMEAGEYLFYAQSQESDFVISQTAADCFEGFFDYLKKGKSTTSFRQSLKELEEAPAARFQLINQWVEAFAQTQDEPEWKAISTEVAALIFRDAMNPAHVVKAAIVLEVEGLVGEHSTIESGKLHQSYHDFMRTMWEFASKTVPGYQQYTQLKTSLTHRMRDELNLETFQPKVLTSFVRNQLIDKVYLPLIGTNLAKQIGTVGDQTRTDRMGLLLLISPPGYGKTTLMEYVANRLGLIFMKINGPAIGHEVRSLDPADAPHAAAREELQKLNLALEMGDNIMLYVDDIQHCNPEFLQKFISLCDAQRKIEGVYKGRTRTYDLRGKKVAVVMAGNPYTEQGEKFRIPDMLANRADTYNLGDIIGDSAAFFKKSYIENSLTSHPVLNALSTRPAADIQGFIQWAEMGHREGIEFEGSYTADELSDYVSVLKKLIEIREIILKVNQAYIHSAGQEELYRTEPPFLLQGSYRNMNQLAEQVMPVMNEDELKTLILSHYEQESQTLTTGAEANLLKFKQLAGWAEEADHARWTEICRKFREHAAANADRMAQLVAEMGRFSQGLEGIRNALSGMGE